MSSLRCIAGVLAAVTCCLPASVRAQIPPEAEGALARHLEDVTAQYLAADSAADRAEAAVLEAARADSDPQDTLMVGPLRIVTTSDQVAAARPFWEAEWARFASIMGSNTKNLEGTTFTYHRKTGPYPYQVRGYTRLVE